MRFIRRVILLGVVVLLAAGGALYWFVIRSDSPPPLKLSKTPNTAEANSTAPGASPDGTWTVIAGGKSVVGYRVTEQLADLALPSDAVGRTPAVEGTLKLGGTTVESAEVIADLRQLKSDKDRRDHALHGRGLQTDTFPEATFRLTTPITLGGPPKLDEKITAQATGDLTLHGVTKHIEMSVDARWTGDRIEVVGHLPITFTDYDIQPPSIAGILTVEDHGAMELQLFFGHA